MPPKPLPQQTPNPGERLVIRNLLPNGRYDWFYSKLTAAQIARTGDPLARVIEVHIDNFSVSNLEAALSNFPVSVNRSKIDASSTATTSTNGTGIFLVVDLDENFSAATDQALEFINTVGINNAPYPGAGTIEGRAGSTDFEVTIRNTVEDMRRVVF